MPPLSWAMACRWFSFWTVTNSWLTSRRSRAPRYHSIAPVHGSVVQAGTIFPESATRNLSPAPNYPASERKPTAKPSGRWMRPGVLEEVLEGMGHLEAQAVQPVLAHEHPVTGQRLLEGHAVEDPVQSRGLDDGGVDRGEVREFGQERLDVPEHPGLQRLAHPGHALVQGVDVRERPGGEGGIDLLLLGRIRHPLELEVDAAVLLQSGHDRA